MPMTTWMAGDIRANGVTLHYERSGGPKHPVVLLHGLAGNGACWTPLARFLEVEYDVVMPDARGHGKSGSPLFGYRYEDHANDVLELIRGVGLVDPVLLGHSMGGMTAAVAASRAVEPIRGLILVDPTFLDPPRQREVRDSDVAEQHRRLLGLDQRELSAQLRARHPSRTSEIVDLLASARLQTRMSAFDVLTPPNPEYRQLLRAIRIPILLVLGDAGVVSPEAAQELQDLNSRVRVEKIEGAGHGVPYDQPERLVALVRSFLHSVVT